MSRSYFLKLTSNFTSSPPYEREVWSYQKAKVEHVNREVSLFDWHGVLSPLDVNEQVKLFNETLKFLKSINSKKPNENSKPAKPNIKNVLDIRFISSLIEAIKIEKQYNTNQVTSE